MTHLQIDNLFAQRLFALVRHLAGGIFEKVNAQLEVEIVLFQRLQLFVLIAQRRSVVGRRVAARSVARAAKQRGRT